MVVLYFVKKRHTLECVLNVGVFFTDLCNGCSLIHLGQLNCFLNNMVFVDFKEVFFITKYEKSNVKNVITLMECTFLLNHLALQAHSYVLYIL